MLLASFTLPHRAVALEETFEAVPELTVEAERIAAHSTEWVMPCLWAAQTNFDAVEEAFEVDPTVAEIVERQDFDEETYYQIEWSDEVKRKFDMYLDMGASILDATADSKGWQVRIRFASRDQFDKFRESLTDEGLSFTLLKLTEPGAPRQSFGRVTPEQRNALVAAEEYRYYNVPRETTLRELAKQLDISHQTLSEHLRRGTANLIDATLKTKGVSFEEDG